MYRPSPNKFKGERCAIGTVFSGCIMAIVIHYFGVIVFPENWFYEVKPYDQGGECWN